MEASSTLSWVNLNDMIKWISNWWTNSWTEEDSGLLKIKENKAAKQ